MAASRNGEAPRLGMNGMECRFWSVVVGCSDGSDAERVVCVCIMHTYLGTYIYNIGTVDSYLHTIPTQSVVGMQLVTGCLVKGREASPCMPVLIAITRKLVKLLLLIEFADWW
jgi:hypothetical protein